MRATAGVILTALAAITIAACGGSSRSAAPVPSISVLPLSAAAACSGFASWRQQTQGNPTDWNKSAILVRATSQAPRGRLFDDMFTLESDVLTSQATGSVGKAYENMIPSAVSTVTRDCRSMNPDS
jgi:hypothetical protein